jgi:hypothetical protein
MTATAEKPTQLSRNEAEMLCLKAARGAGMSWGMAEEAGFAAAWLAMTGIDGPGALLAQLESAAGRTWQQICPAVTAGHWAATGADPVCPIAAGAALCDFAALPEANLSAPGIAVGPLSYPVLLLPFLAFLAKAQSCDVAATWPGGAVTVNAEGGAAGDLTALSAVLCLTLKLTRAEKTSLPHRNAGPVPTSAATLKGLNALALRTTVPPSEASRANAGAAAGDND